MPPYLDNSNYRLSPYAICNIGTAFLKKINLAFVMGRSLTLSMTLSILLVIIIFGSSAAPLGFDKNHTVSTHSDSGIDANFNHPSVVVVGSEIESMTFSAVQAFGSEAEGDCTPPIVCPQPEPPVKIADIPASGSLSQNSAMVAMDGILYFDANTPKSQLWNYDPSTDSISEITTISQSSSYGGQVAKYGGFAILDHILYFDATESGEGTELWAYSPLNDTYWMIEGIRPGSGSSKPVSSTGLVPMSGKLWFNAEDGAQGSELWSYDPSTGSAEIVVDLFPGSSGSSPGVFSGLVPISDRWLFFDADDGTSGIEPWVHDTLTGQTTLLGDINPGTNPSLPGYLLPFMEVGNHIIFDASNQTYGTELWAVNKTAQNWEAILVCDIWHGSQSGQPSSNSDNPAILGDRIYFSARDQNYGSELWSFNSADQTCTRNSDIRPGSQGSNPGSVSEGFHKIGGIIAFSANDGTSGNELWYYSPENSTSWLSADLTTGVISSYPGQYSGFTTTDEGNAYFTASSNGVGYEPHVIDATDFSVSLLEDIRTGSHSSEAAKNTGFVILNRDMYFDAKESSSGNDLWVVRNATNNSAVAWTISPSLPYGLEISPVDGTISGTPTQATGLSTYQIDATNSSGVTASIHIEIAVLSDNDLDGMPDSVPDALSTYTDLISDPDDDNDGISDSIEENSGSSPLNVDSDYDGFCDGPIQISGVCTYGPDPFPINPNFPVDTDGDGLADSDFDGTGPAVADDDDDNDGFNDSEDDFPLDPSDWLDTDGDTVGDLSDTDDDNDGIDDVDEYAAGTDPTSVDTDGDGICDGPYARQSCNTGPDPYPVDHLLPMDSDGDGLWDDLPDDASENFLEDYDDDGDGLDDIVETGTGFYISPSDRGTDPLNPDSDGDGFCDGSNEVMGVCSRGEDPEPFNPNIPMDRDQDRLADQVDPQWPAFYGDEDADDDGDGYTDSMEYKCDSSALNPNDVPDDLDGDFICDDEDPDMDGDGSFNSEDRFPEDPNDWSDFDNDGIGDNSDLDSDGDGLANEYEHPECILSLDCDMDGTPDVSDPFPTDPTEYSDTDSDGIGDNSDPDSDGDQICDGSASFPGICSSGPDAFPYDPAAYLDTDGDGLTDYLIEGIPSTLVIDLDDDGDGWDDIEEIRCRSDPLDFNDVPSDVDNNKECESVGAQVSETFAVFGAFIALLLVVGLFMTPLIRDRLRKRNESSRSEDEG